MQSEAVVPGQLHDESSSRAQDIYLPSACIG